MNIDSVVYCNVRYPGFEHTSTTSIAFHSRRKLLRSILSSRGLGLPIVSEVHPLPVWFVACGMINQSIKRQLDVNSLVGQSHSGSWRNRRRSNDPHV